jgi:hypothetical protein
MSTEKQAAADKSKGRLPAPTLFIGPPSRNASHTSLLPDAPPRVSLSRQRSPLSGTPRLDTKVEGVLSQNDDGISSPFTRRPNQQQLQTEKQTNERTDALWAEMQNTLEEVELSATTGTHIFSPDHSKALEELRMAQIALAQAWAKSEADEELQGASEDKKTTTAEQPLNAVDTLVTDRTEKHGTVAGEGRKRSGTDGSVKSQLEGDTENDIAMARKRREANDRYFRRVNTGVVDVVQKLEQVANAMKVVEMESKEIWGDKDSMDSGSLS